MIQRFLKWLITFLSSFVNEDNTEVVGSITVEVYPEAESDIVEETIRVFCDYIKTLPAEKIMWNSGSDDNVERKELSLADRTAVLFRESHRDGKKSKKIYQWKFKKQLDSNGLTYTAIFDDSAANDRYITDAINYATDKATAAILDSLRVPEPEKVEILNEFNGK